MTDCPEPALSASPLESAGAVKLEPEEKAV
jgi:hypothetical protein